MNEFDFEELDKAVNSLMTKAPAQAKNDTDTSSVTQSSTQLNEQTNAEESILDANTNDSTPQQEIAGLLETNEATPVIIPSQEQPNVTPTPTLATTPTVKRSGRFMDVVHPSSDMRSSATLEAPTSRQGIALQPLSSSVPTSPTEAVEVEPLDELSAPLENSVIDSGTSDSFSSPFLPDTQVEKRPLGGFASENPEDGVASANPDVQSTAQYDADLPLEPLQPKVDLASELAKDSDTQDDSTNDRPTDVDMPVAEEKPFMPEELHSDLVAIEANELEVETESIPTVTTESQPDLPPEDVSSATETIIATEPEQVEPVIGSIPQQYQEQASSVEPTHTPLYAESSAQPIAVAPKKKSWVLIVLILLIAILLAVAIAAGLFFAGLI